MKKNKKIKEKKYLSEDENQIRSLVFIILGALIFLGGIYFLTVKLTTKKVNKPIIEFNYSLAMVGTILNRPYDEYYVLLYEYNSEDASAYQTLENKYNAKDDAKKLYTVDLSKNLDDKYLSDKSNFNIEKISDIRINKVALLLIKNGKIAKYFETKEDIEKVLK